MSGEAPYQPAAGWLPGSPPGGFQPDLRWPIELWYWSAEVVTFRKNRSALITNSPLAAGLFYGARAAGNTAARRRAGQLAQPQWRLAGTGQVVLDDTGMTFDGSWGGQMRVEYAEVPTWQRDQDSLQVNVIDYYPLMLRAHGIDQLVASFSQLSGGKLWQELVVQAWQPAPQVAVGHTEQRDRRFSCAVPDGFEPLNDRAYLANAAQDSANSGMRLLFMLRHRDFPVLFEFDQIADRQMLQGLAADPGAFERGALRLATLKARNAGGEVVARPAVVIVGGERATMIDTTMVLPHVKVRFRELYVGRRGQWFMIALHCADPYNPQALFDQFAPAFQTLIATWQWRF
jgi:hypothetical protein